MDINDIGSTDMDGWELTTKEMTNATISKKDCELDKEGFLNPMTFKGVYHHKTCKSRKLSFPNLSTGVNPE